jgi:hypothetical protein
MHLFICSAINHGVSLGASSTDSNFLPNDSSKDYYLSSQRRVSLLSLSYGFLALDRLMRTFLGLPLVATMLDVTS